MHWVWILVLEARTKEGLLSTRDNIAAFTSEPKQADLLKALQNDKRYRRPEKLAEALESHGAAVIPGGALVLDEVPVWEVAVPEGKPTLYKILKDARKLSKEGKL